MKVVVSSLLLSFATFWFAESVYPSLSDLLLIPLFAAFALIVHWIANRPSPTQNLADSKSGEKVTESPSKP